MADVGAFARSFHGRLAGLPLAWPREHNGGSAGLRAHAPRAAPASVALRVLPSGAARAVRVPRSAAGAAQLRREAADLAGVPRAEADARVVLVVRGRVVPPSISGDAEAVPLWRAADAGAPVYVFDRRAVSQAIHGVSAAVRADAQAPPVDWSAVQADVAAVLARHGHAQAEKAAARMVRAAQD